MKKRKRKSAVTFVPVLADSGMNEAFPRLKTRTPVWAINYQNQMDDFFAEMKRNNERALESEAEAEADRKFIWAGVLAVLAVAGVVMLLTYWAVEGF